MQALSSIDHRVVIAIDPHKASWTAAAVGESLQPFATLRVPVSPEGYRSLHRFARTWQANLWAIEGAHGMGAPLTAQLARDGVDVVDVPAKLAARVRLLSTGHGRKNDDADALSVGIAALNAAQLTTVTVDDAAAALRAIVEHREDLVKTRTQTINRLHVVLTRLSPGGAPGNLTADRAATLLSTLRPRDPALKTFRALATDLVSEIRHLDRRIAKAVRDIKSAVTASKTTLTELHGIGTLSAAKIISHVGSIDRFRSAAAFATYTGTAPIEVSSGDVTRHRLSRAGNRQLNSCLHVMALTQVRNHPPAQAYYQRKRSEGKSKREAMRCLKRRLSDAVYRQLTRDARLHEADPGGHPGAALSSRAAG
ncbi:IS110 family RNA-guided transposase [[Mycobacterium] zoologicum]|uniref:IS110 family transposase n=1 Tax=[Mycobacterium] zoologicum TaxID=2872311 RepID=UPI002C8D07C1|nr:IS110 family transposase [Mycolicibacter sp. MYC101]MEB3063873.1 IS110 family transposase [Mycolicibacter sp. MYC101]